MQSPCLRTLFECVPLIGDDEDPCEWRVEPLSFEASTAAECRQEEQLSFAHACTLEGADQDMQRRVGVVHLAIEELENMCMRVRACVRVRMRMRVRAYVCACARACLPCSNYAQGLPRIV